MMQHFDMVETSHDLERSKTILLSGIFEPHNLEHPLRESAFVELMICLRDLMAKVEKYSTRISFTDDVILSKMTRDITDTITNIRDSICHINSFKRVVDDRENRVAFCSISGKGRAFDFGDVVLQSDYDDETCFFYGCHRIYLKRHIIRALNEAEEKLQRIT